MKQLSRNLLAGLSLVVTLYLLADGALVIIYLRDYTQAAQSFGIALVLLYVAMMFWSDE